ncbi:MAG: ribosomal-protein-alanine N-acetyltransferase [Clostridiales bacterium]|uniref:[Ribosomal protein bS18]-alanine N-acetyltransferase n=1 Tax=Harryflintia acetispora TaxID=1849041 RepID=A0A9X8ULK4_9FIRM|nr:MULTISPECIES: ribosomal protein S18-alanine N-acetyltransferase [Oscillospiraceae]PWM36612.1 MAG: ribosomal-protein-alanine N-acetyltransferase [Clostridiales bacterium]RGB68847.1 ribosomal-protein-alanine N-acetyltransferase [Harryflintia acetispora]TCL45326.1 ribosomal-protein-alanine N-acetyltransferase [Harryflintia acetispora]
MTQSSLRPARESDLQALHEIERACFGSQGWSEESLRALLQNPLSDVLVLESDGRACGYAGMNSVLDEGYINDIAVLPEFRRRGFGQALLEGLIARAGERQLRFLTLEARESNRAALALYEKNGFLRAGIRRGFYAAPREDAILLTRYFD